MGEGSAGPLPTGEIYTNYAFWGNSIGGDSA
jgi:hypothetical protein